MITSVPHHLRALPIAFQTIQLDSQDTQNEGPNCLDGYLTGAVSSINIQFINFNRQKYIRIDSKGPIRCTEVAPG